MQVNDMKQNEQKNKTILVVDDDTRIRDLLRIVLESRGFAVTEAENGTAALQAFSASAPDMVILDVMMPVMDGFVCCQRLRAVSNCPILMLTAKGEDYDQVQGLDAGADDYIIKPFTPMVLVARVEALFRRSDNGTNRNAFGSMKIDAGAREVLVENVPIPLSRKEYDLLMYLVDNYNISLNRDQILESVWGYDYLGSSNTVDTHINRLRNKLGKCGAYITTLRGYGYRFEAEQ
ncbi:MAG: response regulator transcription factor [Eubacteriales bacterium]|nr:response regulator transcription factor [Eubacteriales bacterium]